MNRRKRKRTLILAIAAVMAVTAFVPLVGTDPAFAARDWGGTTWKVDGKRVYTGESYGGWKNGIRARADGSPGDSISMSSGKSVSNSLSGNVGISKSKLNAAFHFNVSRQWSSTASKSYGLTKKKKGTWWKIQYKRVYRNYKIKARMYSFYDGTWHKTRKTKWIKAKKFDHFAYRLVKAKAVK